MAHEAQTLIAIQQLGHRAGKIANLALHTRKGAEGYIYSTAGIEFHGNGSISYMLHGDFQKLVLRSKSRATRGNIDRQHVSVFTPHMVESLKAEALHFYEKQDKKIEADREAYEARKAWAS